MPIYEEKLVSPLAIRFTQDHIRTTFRDGRAVDAAIEEVGTAPGVGDYDVVLTQPFPHIEILRWCVPRESADVTTETLCPVGVRPREHWFTLDNRRLYCLQRAAVAQWPKRVAAVVEILYADSGSVRKKFDSTSFGWSVTLSHSYDAAPVLRWDWREQVLPLEVQAATEPHGVLATVLADDRKRTVSALLDATPKPDSILGTGASAASNASPKGSAKACCPTPSTMEGSEASDAPFADQQAPPAPAALEPPKPAMDEYNPVVANAIREIKEQLNIRGSDGTVRIPHWDDRYGETLGSLLSFLESRPDKFTVTYEEGDRFTVQKARRRAAEAGYPPELAAAALAEVEAQLNVPRHDGRVSIPHWGERYEDALGSLRSFLKSQPDKFTVIQGEGRHFRVVKSCDGTAMHAIRDIEECLDRPDSDGHVSLPQWGERYSSELGALRDFISRWPDKFTIVPGEGADFTIVRTRDALAQQAIVEIEVQLADPDFDGRLRIPHWAEQYAPLLGPMRAFLEGRPDKFIVTAGEDRHFTVEKCSEDIAERALREVEEQVSDPRHDGRVRVARWNERYKEALGPLRTFLERYPERFRVIPVEGTKFLVARADQVPERHGGSRSSGRPQRHSGQSRTAGWEGMYAGTLQ